MNATIVSAEAADANDLRYGTTTIDRSLIGVFVVFVMNLCAIFAAVHYFSPTYRNVSEWQSLIV